MEFTNTGGAPSKRLTGLGVVLLVHVLVVYALVTGLAHKVVEIVKQPIETRMIEEVKPPPPPFIPPPEVAVATPPAQNTIAAVSNVKPDNPVFAPPQKTDAAPAASRIAAVVDFSTCAKPDYPRNSQRNEEQGTVTLAFLIGLDGHVVDSRIEKSSGFRELDKAAQRGLSQCKFKPAIVDGKPQQGWSNVQYVWRLE